MSSRPVQIVLAIVGFVLLLIVASILAWLGYLPILLAAVVLMYFTYDALRKRGTKITLIALACLIEAVATVAFFHFLPK